MMTRITRAGLVVCLVAGFCQCCQTTSAQEGRWKQSISYQGKGDLFANYQVGPHACGAAAQMYISPLPVPPLVGHTYTTYQPWMPHEYLHKHTRTHYGYVQGSGWSRAKIRYRTGGLLIQDWMHDHNPRF